MAKTAPPPSSRQAAPAARPTAAQAASPAPAPAPAPSQPAAAPSSEPGLPPVSDGPTGDPVRDFRPEAFNLEKALSDVKPPIDTPPVPPSGEPPTPTPAGTPPKPEDLEARRAGNDSLRRELEAANERLRALEARESEWTNTRTTLERERDETLEKFKQRSRELEETRKLAGRIDPRTDGEIIAINTKWDGLKADAKKNLALEGMKPGHLESNIPKLLEQYGKLGDPDSPEFEERASTFNQTVRENFPGHEQEIKKLIGAGFDLQKQIHARVGDLTTHGDAIRMEREKEAYRGILTAYSDKEARFFKPTDDLRTNDPFNAEVICSELLDTTEDTKKGRQQIIAFCRDLALPPEPLDPRELSKMPLEEQNRYLQARHAAQSAKRERVQMMLPIALASMRLLPGVYKQMLEWKREVEALRGDNPPPPSGDPHDDEPAPGSGDIRDYEPHNPLLEEEGIKLR